MTLMTATATICQGYGLFDMFALSLTTREWRDYRCILHSFLQRKACLATVVNLTRRAAAISLNCFLEKRMSKRVGIVALLVCANICGMSAPAQEHAKIDEEARGVLQQLIE